MVPSKAEAGQPFRPKLWVTFASLSTAAGVTALVVFSSALFSGRSSTVVKHSASEPMPTGTIAETDIEFCRRLRFNDDGRVFQDAVQCDQSGVRDARGQPVPVGTMRRLDAISKSFSNH